MIQKERELFYFLLPALDINTLRYIMEPEQVTSSLDEAKEVPMIKQTGADSVVNNPPGLCCTSCSTRVSSVFLAIWVITLILMIQSTSVLWIEYFASRLAFLLISVISLPYYAIVYIFFSGQTSSNVKSAIQAAAIKDGLAQQFSSVVMYARASQLEYLDQEAAQWIMVTQKLIMEALKANFLLVRGLYHSKTLYSHGILNCVVHPNSQRREISKKSLHEIILRGL